MFAALARRSAMRFCFFDPRNIAYAITALDRFIPLSASTSRSTCTTWLADEESHTMVERMKKLGPKRLLVSACTLLAAAPWAVAGQIDSCKPIASLEAYTLAKSSPRGATCATYVSQSSEIGVSCYWEFPYRNASAEQMANSLWSTLQKCRPGRPLGPDQSVNHPDSFHLREWTTGNATYRISLKDKAGQRRTLVFLSFEKA